ncbi:hypothetical protein IAU60_004192 [Kwoniella sp. DSM 27419]
MPPRIPLPRLTLFTGGKECSLCEVAKHELGVLRRTTPFELDLWDIRDPPANVDAKEAKKWRRLYQYDIPVLHLGDKRIQKHRIDKSKLQEAIEEWQASQGQAGDNEVDPPGRELEGGATAWQPYKSVTRFFSEPTGRRSGSEDEEQGASGDGVRDDQAGCEVGRKTNTQAPWRTYLGKAFFHLPSPVGEYTPRDDWDTFAAILSSTFKGFSDTPVGSDIAIVDLSKPAETIAAAEEDGASWQVDTTAGPVAVDGEGGDVLYEEPISRSARQTSSQTCWNCLESGHSFTSCPHPRNPAQIRHSRDAHNYARDFVMPEHAVPSLELYLSMRVTDAERDRRLELVDLFQPGSISPDLAQAVTFVDSDVDELEDLGTAGMEDGNWLDKQHALVKRRTRRWDWYDKIMHWGYPPGWVTGRDPVKVIKARIQRLITYDQAFDLNPEIDDEDLLQIFGGNLGTPASSVIDLDLENDSSSASSDSTARRRHDGPLVKAGHDSDTDMELDAPSIATSPSSTSSASTARAWPSGADGEHLGVSPPSSPPPLPPPPPNDDVPPPPPEDDAPPAPPLLPDTRFSAGHNSLTPAQPVSTTFPTNTQNPYLLAHFRRLPATVPKRWARYDTDLFDSERLTVYDPCRPFPIGGPR